uniref:hypothetical protein n=1 Tax=Pappia fissilis TaxID=1040649 RepID=UPI002A835D7C|nr:hypothetical protein UYP79_mgp008 [Pappia fissilis]WOX61250.1 hypothetical protein [Pappia fissilis]
MMLFINNVILSFFSGFIVNYLLFNIILFGLFGSFLKNQLLTKIEHKDDRWFNTLLSYYFILLIFCFLIDYHINIVYLDDNIVNFNVYKFKVSVTGDVLKDIIVLFGSSGAFVIGSNFGYAVISKYSLNFISKVGASAANGVGFSFLWQIVVSSQKSIQGKGILTRSGDNSITIEMNNVSLCQNLNGNLEKLPIKNIDQNINIRDQFLRGIDNNNFISGNKLIDKIAEYKEAPESRIISIIEKEKNSSITDIFKNSGYDVSNNVNITEDIVINSPLESNELSLILKNQLIEILSYNFMLHCIMLYLILMIIFIFTIKLIADNNLLIEKIKILPLGKYIYIIVNKVIYLWSKSNNFWIYYLSISLFIMMLGATYGLYACLVILNWS